MLQINKLKDFEGGRFELRCTRATLAHDREAVIGDINTVDLTNESMILSFSQIATVEMPHTRRVDDGQIGDFSTVSGEVRVDLPFYSWSSELSFSRRKLMLGSPTLHSIVILEQSGDQASFNWESIKSPSNISSMNVGENSTSLNAGCTYRKSVRDLLRELEIECNFKTPDVGLPPFSLSR
jgi:hypothetical protein